jgi:hypothetical protein
MVIVRLNEQKNKNTFWEEHVSFTPTATTLRAAETVGQFPIGKARI